MAAFVSVADGEKMDREIKILSDLKEGDIVRGYVKSCSDVGVFVRLVLDCLDGMSVSWLHVKDCQFSYKCSRVIAKM